MGIGYAEQLNGARRKEIGEIDTRYKFFPISPFLSFQVWAKSLAQSSAVTLMVPDETFAKKSFTSQLNSVGCSK